MREGQITEAVVQETLGGFQDPETGRSVTQLKQVRGLKLDGERLSVTLGLTSWAAPVREDTRAELIEFLR